MKERPILFSGPMVRALLDGSKTQTRRVMRYQPDECASVTVERFHQTVVDRYGEEQPGPEVFGAWWADGEHGCACPYGQPGDRLWVRESWAYNPDHPGIASRACYMADPEHKHDGLKWKPSIHMPQAVCRIILEITGVHVERLQDISEADAIAEGIPEEGTPCPRCHYSGWVMQGGDPVQCDAPGCGDGAVDEYRTLWNSINGPGSWDANPWVWVVEFKRVLP